MKLFITIFLIFIASSSLYAGTIFCSTKDLATADILSEEKIDFLDFSSFPIILPIVNDYSYSLFKLDFNDNGDIHYNLSSTTDYENQVVESNLKTSDFKKKIQFKTTSISSYSLNLDTLYTKCEWNP